MALGGASRRPSAMRRRAALLLLLPTVLLPMLLLLLSPVPSALAAADAEDRMGTSASPFGLSGAAARRRLQGFRVSIGPITFTDDSEADTDPFGILKSAAGFDEDDGESADEKDGKGEEKKEAGVADKADAGGADASSSSDIGEDAPTSTGVVAVASIDAAAGADDPADEPPPAPASSDKARPRAQPRRPPAGAAGRTLQLPRCYFSDGARRCFLNPYYPLAYAPPGGDPAARFEMKLIAHGYSCWRHTTPGACAKEAAGQCRWVGSGGGDGKAAMMDSPMAALWRGMGRPCVLDEGLQQKAAQEFYLCPGSKVQRYVQCAAAETPSACAAAKGCAWSEATAYDNSTLSYVMGAMNDTLSWLTVRPLGALPLDARCKPADLRFEDGEEASGPPLDARMWGACNTVRRLNGEVEGAPCDPRKQPAACPQVDPSIYEHFVYGGMLRRTRALLGGGAWAQQLVADWWACDSKADDRAACQRANVTAPVFTERPKELPAAPEPDAAAAVPAGAAAPKLELEAAPAAVAEVPASTANASSAAPAAAPPAETPAAADAKAPAASAEAASAPAEAAPAASADAGGAKAAPEVAAKPTAEEAPAKPQAEEAPAKPQAEEAPAKPAKAPADAAPAAERAKPPAAEAADSAKADAAPNAPAAKPAEAADAKPADAKAAEAQSAAAAAADEKAAADALPVSIDPVLLLEPLVGAKAQDNWGALLPTAADGRHNGKGAAGRAPGDAAGSGAAGLRGALGAAAAAAALAVVVLAA